MTPYEDPVPSPLPSPAGEIRLSLGSLPVPAAVSRQGRYLQVNPAFLELFGYRDPADLVGRPLLDQIAPAEREAIRTLNQQREEGRAAPADYETTGLRKNGSTFPMQVRVTSLPLPAGLGTLALMTDLSDPRHFTEHLRRSEETFRTLVEQSTDVIFELDAEGCFTFVSPAWERHFDFPASEVMGHPFVPFVHPDDVGPCMAYLGRVLGTGEAGTSPVYRVRRADGTWRWFVANGTRTLPPEGPPRFLGVGRDITDAHHDREALEEAHRFNEQIIQGAQEGVVVYGPDLRYRVWNAYMERLTGLAAHQVLGRNPGECFPFLMSAGVLDRVARILGGETVAPVEFPFEIPTTGKSGWASDTSTALLDGDGGIIGVIGLISDITQRKRDEEALLVARHNAERYLGVVQVIMVALDAQGRVTMLNPKGHELLGYAEGELLGRNWFETCLPPEERAMVAGTWDRVMAGEMELAAYFENQVLLRDGERRLIAWHNAPVRDDAGRVIGTLSSGEDITERRQAEILLRENEAQLRTIFEASEAGIILVNDRGVITFANQRMAELFGMSLEALIGTTYPDHLHPSEKVEGDSRMRMIITGEIDRVSVERLFLRADGTTFWGHLSGRRQEGPDGSLRSLVGIITDVTKRRQAEEQQSLLQAQLHQAQKLESLGALAGGVAHDMNNVLGAVLGLASAHIESQPVGSPARQAFGTIIKAAERGGNLLKGLLTFARQGSAEEQQDLDLNAILQEEVRLLERTTLSRVHLVMDLEPDLRPVRGDAGALTHAFMNLCVNAVDAMPEPGTLTLRSRNLPGDRVEVQVQDTGTGMPREVLERALDPFFTTKEVGKGTGLGLSIVYNTLKAHHGEIELQSEVGRGTTVFLRFPARPLPSEPQEGCGPGALMPFDGALEVLLVDDDELIQNSMLGMLELLGHQPVLATSGEEALARLEGGLQPDVVILDMNMPGLGGVGTLPRLRVLRPRVPVLLTTGRADQTAQDLVQGHPFVTLLPKPFGMRELQAHLAPFLR